MALATTAGKDPDDWFFHIYRERSDPWEQYLNIDPENTTKQAIAPIINVWFEQDNVNQSGSQNYDRQDTKGLFNIDCYGMGISQNVAGGGYLPGDQVAALESQRAARFGRNVIMSATYLDLELPVGVVSQKWMSNKQVFERPQIENNAVQDVIATRMQLEVRYLENAPQITAEVLEEIYIKNQRATDQFVLSEVEIDFTA